MTIFIFLNSNTSLSTKNEQLEFVELRDTKYQLQDTNYIKLRKMRYKILNIYFNYIFEVRIINVDESISSVFIYLFFKKINQNNKYYIRIVRFVIFT